MPVKRPWRKPATLPLLALVVAWICVNLSQTLNVSVIHWAKGARHFSHQQQLREEVDSLLSGRHAKAALASAQPEIPPAPAAPAPEESIVKKIDLASSREAGTCPVPSEAVTFEPADVRAAPGERAEPPHLPPRAGVPV